MIDEFKKQLDIIKSYMAFVERNYMYENEKPYDNWAYGYCCGAIYVMEQTLKEMEDMDGENI